MKKTIILGTFILALVLAGCGNSDQSALSEPGEVEESQSVSTLEEDLGGEDSAEDQENSPESSEEERKEEASKENSFHYDEESGTYYGKLVVEGYLTTQEVPEPFCEENCAMHTYAFFNVLKSDNDSLGYYLKRQEGNSFVGEGKIGLGCVKDGVLWRMNDSDEFGMKRYENSPEESEKIIGSSAESPIKIELERYLYTSGRGAPACYSHFAQVEIVE
jgi:hypothetical protein